MTRFVLDHCYTFPILYSLTQKNHKRLIKMTKSIYCSIDHTEQTLPVNLYKDNKGRAGVWRYKHPQDGIKYLHNLVEEVQLGKTGIIEAIEVAAFLNETLYAIQIPGKQEHIIRIKDEPGCFYVDWVTLSEVEDETPENARWHRQKKTVETFCEHFAGKAAQDITMNDCQIFIKSMPYHSGRSAKIALNKFFHHLNLVQAVDKFNPFKPGNSEEIKLRKVPAKQRRRMDKEDLAMMISKAEEINQTWLGDALKLGILLRLRRDDIVNLQFSDVQVEDNFMHCTVNKSVNQKGIEQGQILLFDLREPSYKEAHEVIQEAYKNRLKDVTRNTHKRANKKAVIEEAIFIINHKPQNIPAAMPKGKIQITQVTPDFLSKQFNKCRALCPAIEKKAEKEGLSPTSFHELRSLGARIDLQKGMDVESISATLAHSDIDVTKNKYLSENMQRIEVAKTAVTLQDFK